MDYHSDTSRISKSGLDLIAKSPAHYWHRYLNPKKEPEKKTPALIQGSATHLAVFEPDIFREQVVEGLKIDKRSNDNKAKWAEFEEENKDKIILTGDEMRRCLAMYEAVYKNNSMKALLEKGIAERRVDFIEPNTGAKCKIKHDWWSENTEYLCDLKTTDDASPSGFGKSAFNYRYYVQAPFYTDGCILSGTYQPRGFAFLVVEKEPPYNTAIYFVDAREMQMGREQYLRDLEVYQKCLQDNDWPGYGDYTMKLQLPGWAYKSN